MDKKVAYNNLMRLYDMLSEEYKQSLDVFLTDYKKSANSTSIPSYNEIRDGQEFYGNGYKKGYEDAKQEFKRPIGEWKSLTRVSGKVIGECPFCNGEQVAENYCSYCGAKLYRALP